MKIIAKQRGMGKTAYLVKKSMETGCPIVVATQAHKDAIKDKYGCSVNVMTIHEARCYGTRPKSILIDEVELVLEQLFNSKVEEVTFTGDIEIEKLDYVHVPIAVKQTFNMCD